MDQGCQPARSGSATTTAPKAPTWAPSLARATVRFEMASIKVVLAEDNALLREGISRIIDGEADFDLVGRAADLPELLELIEDTSPDVVVTDIRMPPTGTDEGIQAASWLREHKPEVGVVVLSQYKTPSYALSAPGDRVGGEGLPAEGAGGRCRRAGPGHPDGRGSPGR